MIRRAVIAIAVLLLGLVVLSNTTYKKRKQQRAILDGKVSQYVAEAKVTQLVDCGVELRVVVRDPNGQRLVPGKPKLRVVRTHYRGAMLDTHQKCFVGPSQSRRVWYCSEAQEAVLLHEGPEQAQLIYGSEGGGKSTVIAMWLALRWFEMIGEGREIGLVAPTKRRLKMVRKELFKLWRVEWRIWRKSANILDLPDGTAIEMVSTHKRSEEEGSPVQGSNWSAVARDELQDQSKQIHYDITSRARSAKLAANDNGEALYFPQIASATVKDSADFRTLRAEILDSGEWIRRYLLIADSPFVDSSFIDKARRTMSDREFRRRILAEDLPPENAVYPAWQLDAEGRRLNCRPVPRIGARHITSIVLRAKTGYEHHELLIGNDPGTAKAASIYLEAYQLAGERDPVWWVRGEQFTYHKSTEQHVRLVKKTVQDRFGCNKGEFRNGKHHGPAQKAKVYSQPVGQAQDKPDMDVYRIWRREGFDISAAQARHDGKATGHIDKDMRIEMVNRLLCDASGRRRLFVDVDAQGNPVAPRLVQAFESMERDERGRAETEAKTEHDLSDPPAGLGYGLWPFEKESATVLRAAAQRGTR